MGTLGCINDMLQRDKENRELRKLGRERLKETCNRLMEIGNGTKLPDISVKEIKAKLLIAVCTLFIFFLAWLLYSIFK